MQQARTVSQRMASGVRWLQAAARRGGKVGVLVWGLAGVLLPLHVGAVGSGDLDTSFGGNGTVLTDLESGSSDAAYDLAIQPDGKIVVAGNSYGEFGGPDFALARYLPNGALDPSFGSYGTVHTDFGSGSLDEAYTLALQLDGKIVVAGYSELSDRSVFALARYLPNGALDSGFGSYGTVHTDFGSGNAAFVLGLAIQPDGKIVVAGMSTANGSQDFALARYLPNGTLDVTFNGYGTVLTDFGSGSSDWAYALALQPDGKIVVAGVSNASGNEDFALARYLPNGTLDATFSGDGKVTTSFGSGRTGIAYALALQSDGKIVVAGGAYAGDPDMALARYLPNGTLDLELRSCSNACQ